jgi:hypothetical protein
MRSQVANAKSLWRARMPLMPSVLRECHDKITIWALPHIRQVR